MQKEEKPKISMQEYHQKCLAKRKDMMSDIPDVNKNKRISKYNFSMIKEDPVGILETIKQLFSESLSEDRSQIKNKEKFQESLESLRYFTFALTTLFEPTA